MAKPPSNPAAVHDRWTWVSPGVAVSPIGAAGGETAVPAEVWGVTDGVEVPDVAVVVLDVGVLDVGVPDVEVLGGGEVGTIRSRVAGASADRGPSPAAFTAIT